MEVAEDEEAVAVAADALAAAAAIRAVVVQCRKEGVEDSSECHRCSKL